MSGFAKRLSEKIFPQLPFIAMQKGTFKIFRGNETNGEYRQYETEIAEGMVVLDAVLEIQAHSAPDLGVRWNCKAGKCGSCGAEVNGKPSLLCMTRISNLPKEQAIMISPMKTFPVIKDLACDVSWNYEQNKKIAPFKPAHGAAWKMSQKDADRVQEFRKCIECNLCQNVCHVLRTHKKFNQFMGPRYFVRAASLDMHPLDTEERIPFLKEKGGLGYCNITKCCSNVCPEKINITDNAIIPLKERVIDRFYDPVLAILARIIQMVR